ncbi:hypothetical protein SHO565_55910 [Streptomyces sp. HO565]
MWLWGRQGETTYGPASATASAGAATVTATATVTSIRWTMGDGSTVTCTGPGTPTGVVRAWRTHRTADTATPTPAAVDPASSSR